MYILTRNNKVIDYSESPYYCVGSSVVCESKHCTYEDATIVDIGSLSLPADVLCGDYYYYHGTFVKIKEDKSSGSGVNKNLLTNWYFANPVNRRGGFCFVPVGTNYYTDSGLTTAGDAITTGTVIGATIDNETYSHYTVSGVDYYVSTADVKYGYYKEGDNIDRWRTNAGALNVSIGDNSVDLTSIYKWHTFYQPIKETEQYRGQTMTASLYVDSIDKESSFQFGLRTVSESALNNSILLSNSGVYSITWTIPDDATELQFFIQSMIDSAGTISIKAVKLELGDTQTLAYQDDSGNWQLYEIPNYEEEYAKCVAIEPKVNNDNLLMNWYFKNPVNRKNGYYIPKGSTSYSDTGLTTVYGESISKDYPVTIVNSTYASFVGSSGTTLYCKTSDCKKGYVKGGNTIDCWWNRINMNDTATGVFLTDDGLKYEVLATSTSALKHRFIGQRIENYKNLLGKQVTLSVLINDSYTSTTIANFFAARVHSSTRIDYHSAQLGTTTWSNKTGLHSITFTLPETIDSSHTGLNASVYMRPDANTVSVGDYFVIEAVKLELGDKQTLAHQDKDGNWVLNEIPDYQEMYEQCSKYPVEYEATYIGNGGFVPTSGDVTITGTLILSKTTDANPAEDNSPALIIGNRTGGHLEFDGNEIVAKSSETTASALYLGTETVLGTDAESVANTGTPRVRNIYAGTGSMTSGTTSLTTGRIYLQYE